MSQELALAAAGAAAVGFCALKVCAPGAPAEPKRGTPSTLFCFLGLRRSRRRSAGFGRADTARAGAGENDPPPARIAVIGAAWWSQGWHLPQLERNPDAEIAAIMQRSEQPRAAAFLNLTLETKTQLRARYPDAPIYSSCEDMIADKEVMAKIDGVIICTAHACHADMGMKFLAAGKHVLMEKPMTVE
eukprot:COSAG04_NODE_1917_length_5225_cov_3.238393_5_plen_188_part_00